MPAPAGTGVGPWPPTPPVPRPPSFFQRRWPGPSGPARPLVLGAVAVAATVGASVVPLDRPGLGWLLAAVAGAGALGTAATVRPRPAATVAPRPAAPTAPGPTGAPGAVAPPGAPAAPSPTAAAGAPAAPAAAAIASRPPTPAKLTPGPAVSGPASTGTPAAIPAASTTTGGAVAARPGATGASGRAVRLAWAAATLALVGVGTLRAAGWLFVLCLLAAVATTTLAVVGGRSVPGMLVAVLLPPAATARALPWAARGLPRSGTNGPSIGRGLATVAVTAGLLLVFGLLFSSADAVFADLLTGLLPDVSTPGVVGWVFRVLLVGAALLGGAYLLAAPPELDGLAVTPGRTVHRLEWALPLALLDLLFAAFVLVQLTVLFGGSGHVLRTSGLTYATYARGGFWQLLVVSALTLLVIGGVFRWAPRRTRAERILIRLLVGALAALSLVVVASALYRMQVYADAYGATRLRLVVATVEIWLGLLFVLVGVAAMRLRGGWLPRLVLAAAVVALLGLAALNPDRFIAERNIDRYQQSERLDVGYLSGLSADAVPALDRLPEPMRSCALREIAADLPTDGWWAANAGRAQARAVLGRNEAGGCLLPRW
ncbi:DUF4153 domain-containing protein [Micromonospora sp. GCM10011542]|uniref:DUF4153 domain-containing protein n=1 Tax=Micromonospora sp. GCM10011542 TaxID=3317337 RepID=UPI00361AD1A2